MKSAQTVWLLKSVTGILITTCLLLISMSVPLVGNFFILFLPLVVFFYRTTAGRISALLIMTTSLVVVITITGIFQPILIYFLCFLWMGFLLGEGFDRNIPVGRTLFAAWLGVVSIIVAAIIGYTEFLHISISQLIEGYVAQLLNEVIGVYKKIQMPQDVVSRITQEFNQIQKVLVQILPAFYGALVLWLAWGTLMLGKHFLQIKQKMVSSNYKNLVKWRASEHLVWLVIVFGLIYWLTNGIFQTIALNGLILIGALYLIQGLTIVAFLFQKWNVPTWLRIILFILIALQQLILGIIAALGLLDVWLDIRKIRKQPTGS